MADLENPRPITIDDAPWVELTDGIELRMLRQFSEAGGYSAMFRFAPGTVLPKHQHLGCVHAYTLAGRWRYLEYDWIAEPGSYIFEPPGSVHTLAVPNDSEPVVILFIIEAGLVLVADDGAPLSVWDTRAMMELYANGLEALRMSTGEYTRDR